MIFASNYDSIVRMYINIKLIVNSDKDGKQPMFILEKSVVFTGMPGSGKSALGENLSDRFRVKFHDSDSIMSKEAGCPVAVVKWLWPNRFKEVELHIIESIYAESNEPFILSTGDETFCDENVRRLINFHGSIVIWIKAPIETIYDRVVRRSPKHPALDVPNDQLEQSIIDLSVNRYKIYANADIIFETDGTHSINKATEGLIAAINNFENSFHTSIKY